MRGADNPYGKPYTTRTKLQADEDVRHAEVLQALNELKASVGSIPVPVPTVPNADLDLMKTLLQSMEERLAAMNVALLNLAAAQKLTHSKVLHYGLLTTELHCAQDGMSAALLDVLKPKRRRVAVSADKPVITRPFLESSPPHKNTPVNMDCNAATVQTSAPQIDGPQPTRGISM